MQAKNFVLQWIQNYLNNNPVKFKKNLKKHTWWNYLNFGTHFFLLFFDNREEGKITNTQI